MRIIFLIGVFCISLLSYTQAQEGNLKIIQDDKVEWLLNQYKLVNEKNDKIEGYRVQIYSDSGSGSKLRTEKVKKEFDDEYPDIGSYLIYEEPYFKLRVGNFRTRLDARRFLEKISAEYDYAFIVSADIEFPEFELPEVELPEDE